MNLRAPFQIAARAAVAATAFACLLTAAHADELVAPYVNTVEEDVELILDLAGVGPGDYVIDLGAGDGRFVVSAAKRGALGHGVELDPALVDLARRRAAEAGVAHRAAFRVGDIFEASIKEATVITLYLMPEANLKLRPKLLAELRPGTRVVSNSFHMGDWQPDGHVQGRTSGGAMLWIIPAQVAGEWLVDVVGERLHLSLTQRYQEVAATLSSAEQQFSISSINRTGNVLTLTAESGARRLSLHGRMEGQTASGTAHVANRTSTQITSWNAHRRVPGG